MQSFRTNGAIIDILINPYDRFVELYRPDVTATLPYRIALDPELPGLVIELHALD